MPIEHLAHVRDDWGRRVDPSQLVRDAFATGDRIWICPIVNAMRTTNGLPPPITAAIVATPLMPPRAEDEVDNWGDVVDDPDDPVSADQLDGTGRVDPTNDDG